jgi:hypothetical protein
MNCDILHPASFGAPWWCEPSDRETMRAIVAELADTVAQRVRRWSQRRKLLHQEVLDDALQDLWCDVLERGLALLRSYQGERGSLDGYLTALAWDRVRRLLRAERRRRAREGIAASRSDTSRASEPDGFPVELDEVVSALTPGERAFLEENLLPMLRGVVPVLPTAQNAWQLKHRILQKVIAYLDAEGGKVSSR